MILNAGGNQAMRSKIIMTAGPIKMQSAKTMRTVNRASLNLVMARDSRVPTLCLLASLLSCAKDENILSKTRPTAKMDKVKTPRKPAVNEIPTRTNRTISSSDNAKGRIKKKMNAHKAARIMLKKAKIRIKLGF